MTVTPLLAGALAALSVAVGLLAVPLLLDKGPVDRLAERTGGAVAATRRAGPLRRLVERLAATFGPKLLPTLSEARRESLNRKLDLAGRPADLTVQRFLGLKAALSILFGGLMLLLLDRGRVAAARVPHRRRGLVRAGLLPRPHAGASARSASSATCRTSWTSSP